MTEVHPARQSRSHAATQHGPAPLPAAQLEATALIEQAKGVLMSRYDVDAPYAAQLLLVWSAQQKVAPSTVADVLVNDIHHGRESTTDPQLVRWLERCLRNLP
jgi:ANTAR domain